MEKQQNKFFLSLQRLCRKDWMVALMFVLGVLDFLGTTAIVFDADMPFFGAVHFVASVMLILLFVAVYASKDV